jgi:hypothetical protein
MTFGKIGKSLLDLPVRLYTAKEYVIIKMINNIRETICPKIKLIK